MSLVILVGWAAALVGTILGLPQMIRLARTRNVEGLSLPAWQIILGLNIGWTSHGIILGQLNLILPNILGLVSTLPILFLMSRELGRPLAKVMLPGIVLGIGMIATDLLFGTAVYGLVALWPALFANIGQTLELVRSPRVVGVSPFFLIAGVLNQALWLWWGTLVADAGTMITATTTLGITSVNLVWWLMRRAGLRSFLVPSRQEMRAFVRARTRDRTKV
ncbi:MAG TPA: PQ-loop domain-containing transporter [Propionicimonas sp.]